MKPPPRKPNRLNQIESDLRKAKHTIFFVASLFLLVVIIACIFIGIGWDADRAEDQRKEQERKAKLRQQQYKDEIELRRLNRDLEEIRKFKRDRGFN